MTHRTRTAIHFCDSDLSSAGRTRFHANAPSDPCCVPTSIEKDPFWHYGYPPCPMSFHGGQSVVEASACNDSDPEPCGRSCKASNNGGMKAAAFALCLEGFEVMAITAVGNNLITYVFNEMHFSLSESANIVTNFIGSLFLLSLLGGFLSDSYLGSFITILIFGFIEVVGFALLSIQAHVTQLRPPKCNIQKHEVRCTEAKGLQAAFFFVALYIVALGSGCMKPSIISHGADQLGNENHSSSKKLSTFFNALYFSFCCGEIIALTLLVWLQTQAGMVVGFGVSAAILAAGLILLVCGSGFYRTKPRRGSILTRVAQVLVAAFLKKDQSYPVLYGSQSLPSAELRHKNKFRFLEKASIRISNKPDGMESPWRLCTITQVEQVKTIIALTPIFSCTIIFNTILAQLQTFTVQQGSTMNTRLTKGFSIPPASLQSIPYIFLIPLILLYGTVIVPFMRRWTKHPSGVHPLVRIAVGLFVSMFSMVMAALVEQKRRRLAHESGKALSILWMAPQFVIYGISEMLTAVGLVEFFYSQAVEGMQSFFTAMTYCSYAFGFLLSAPLVSLTNKVTSGLEGHGWLSSNDLNQDRLDRFYWLLAGLTLINFMNYVFWSRWYSR